MGRRYVVHTGGKVVTVLDEAPRGPAPEDHLVLRIDRAEEIGRALDTLAQRPELKGAVLFPAGGLPLWDAFRAQFVPVVAAGGVVTDAGGRLLVIRRLGLWDLPKGKVDEGEALPDAAVREVREETGASRLQVVRPLAETWHTYERKGRRHLKCTHWYLMRGDASEPVVPQASEDITEVRWIVKDELPAITAATYPSLLPVFAAWAAEQG